MWIEPVRCSSHVFPPSHILRLTIEWLSFTGSSRLMEHHTSKRTGVMAGSSPHTVSPGLLQLCEKQNQTAFSFGRSCKWLTVAVRYTLHLDMSPPPCANGMYSCAVLSTRTGLVPACGQTLKHGVITLHTLWKITWRVGAYVYFLHLSPENYSWTQTTWDFPVNASG